MLRTPSLNPTTTALFFHRGGDNLQLGLLSEFRRGDKLLKDGRAGVNPSQQLSLHLLLLHTRKTSQLGLPNIGGLRHHLVDKLDFLLSTALKGSDQRAERGRTGGFNVLLQHGFPFGTKFRAHGHTGSLFIVLTIGTSFFVVVTDGWPSALPRATGSTRTTALEVNVGELHVVVILEFLHNIIPAGSLLSSSASPFARNPTNEESMVAIDSVGDHLVVVSVAVKLDGGVKVAIRVDATQDEPHQDQQQKDS